MHYVGPLSIIEDAVRAGASTARTLQYGTVSVNTGIDRYSKITLHYRH